MRARVRSTFEELLGKRVSTKEHVVHAAANLMETLFPSVGFTPDELFIMETRYLTTYELCPIDETARITQLPKSVVIASEQSALTKLRAFCKDNPQLIQLVLD